MIVLGTIVSAAYVSFRAHIKHEDITAAALWTGFVFGILNVPFFGAPKSLGGPQLFPLNGPQYTLFLELVANAAWSLSRRLNELTVAIAIALACFLFLPFGMGGDTAETFWSGFPRVCRRGGFPHRAPVYARIFWDIRILGVGSGDGGAVLPSSPPCYANSIDLGRPVIASAGVNGRASEFGRTDTPPCAFGRRNLLCRLCSSLPDILLGQRSLPSRPRPAEPRHRRPHHISKRFDWQLCGGEGVRPAVAPPSRPRLAARSPLPSFTTARKETSRQA
jgi:hypothetical protein